MSNLSQELFERSLKVAPGGVHSPVRAFKSVGGTPVFFRSGNGAELLSVEGDRYIDFCQSFGPLILGHRDPDVAKVVRETVELAWSFGTCEPYSLELAEWLTARLPWMEKVRFVCSGTEAVMSALRVARAATGRNKILKFDGCYHGHADALLVKAGSGLAGESASDSAGVSNELAAQTLVTPLADSESLRATIAKHGHDIAAVIIEPLPANYGLLVQNTSFLEEVAKAAKGCGALLIFDEVISGFRVALGGMAELTGIKPDLVTYGKVVGGGFPVGCYGGRRELMDLVAPSGPVYQAGTLSANPIGMRAGLATLQKVVSENVYPILERRAADFSHNLQTEFDRHDLDFQVTRVGSVFWLHGRADRPIQSLSDIPKNHAQNFKVLFHACLRRGVYLAPSGYEVGFLSFAHSDSILSEAGEKIVAAAKEANGR